MPDWRSDPTWRLVHADPVHLSGDVPNRPPAAAELCDVVWAHLFVQGVREPVATWQRQPPLPPPREFERLAEKRAAHGRRG